MADVIQKAITANDIIEGAAIVLTRPVIGSGAYQDINPNNIVSVSTDAIESKYTERF